MNDKAAFFFSENEFVAKEKLEIVKDCGEAAQILGGWPSPQAAKCVRAILKIQHQNRKLRDKYNYAKIKIII